MLGKKLYFFYDIRFFERDGHVFSRYGVSDSLMSRYAKLFEEVHYVARRENYEDVFDSPKVNELIETKLHFFGNRYQNVLKTVRECVRDADFCVLRLPSIAGEIGWHECKKIGKPYIIEVVGNIFEALWYYNLKGKVLALPLNIVMKYVVKNATNVAYITTSYLQQCYPTKGRAFSGVANVSLRQVISNEAEMKRIRDYRERKRFAIGLIGAVDVKYKGHIDAINALSIVKEKYPDVELRFLGQGDRSKCVEAIRKLALSDSVFFDGVLPGGDPVFNWLDGINIYIQPSYTEGHGRSVIEAQSRGCIVITSDVGGMRDSVSENYRFEKGNYKQLANMIIKVIEDRNYGEESIKQSIINAKQFLSTVIEAKRINAIKTAYINDEAYYE